VTVGLLPRGAAFGQAAAPLTLKDGDRVVLIGGGLIEQQGRYAYLEARLARRAPGVALRFRNLGWSGDTVTGAARTAGFRQTEEGLARLLRDLRAEAPTVLLLAYGANESFAGPGGLAEFRDGLTRLLLRLRPLGARMVILSPPPHEDLGRPLPDPAEHNRSLEQYTAALREVAGQRRLPFVDLFHPLARLPSPAPGRSWTTNEILPNQYGYWLIAREVERQLFGPDEPWRVDLDSSGKVLGRRGADVARIEFRPSHLWFDITPAYLPAPRPPPFVDLLEPVLRVTGLPPGRYVLRIDGREVARASDYAWAHGVAVLPPNVEAQTEQLRAALVRQGELFYRRWRPFNDFAEHWGYLEGDFKAYDARIAAQDADIARIRRPVALRCEMAPAGEVP
jgi:lysophospholipase L1-like esterase